MNFPSKAFKISFEFSANRKWEVVSEDFNTAHFVQWSIYYGGSTYNN